MNKKIIYIVIILIVIIGGYFISKQKAVEPPTDSDSQSKLNINVVCESALAYMTFPDQVSADKFVEECKNGEHPDVIERYKADMNLGDGAAI